jgi:hypothetical protein
MRQETIEPLFIEQFPAELEEGIIYISMPYGTAAHKCCCGCGRKVITPFGPTDWKLLYDGDTVSLHPSIGNWNFECQSHYWIKNNQIRWASKWSQEEINAGRMHDQAIKAEYFGQQSETEEPITPIGSNTATQGFWERIKTWWSSLRNT